MLKKQIRVIGIDDSPFDKFRDKKAMIIGVFFRGGDFLDGVLSSSVAVDGSDSTSKMAAMVNKSKFYPQLRAIMLKGIAAGGFNLIDIQKLSKSTKVPVIVVMRKLPRLDEIRSALKKLGMKRKIKLLEKAGKITKVGNLYIQFTGCSLQKAKEILRITCTHSYIPEPIRVAHIMASGVAFGESRGKP